MKIIGQIPARLGSKRVKQKNLRHLDGKPLIQYAIEAAKEARTLTDVYVNADSEEIGRLALQHGVKFYQRPAALGSDSATQDEFNIDFIRAFRPDVLVMINPASPLVDGKDIDAMVGHFLEHSLDTLIAAREEQVHVLCQGEPVNFEMKGQLQRTQDLAPVTICSWAVAIWKAQTFVEQYEKAGHAAFAGKVGFFPLDRFRSVKISTEEDFRLAEILMRNMHRWKYPPVPYDSERLGPDYPTMWMSEIRAIEALLLEQARLNPVLNILEWGAGRSSIYFSKFLKARGLRFKWTAMENYIPWHSNMLQMIEDSGLSESTACVLKNATCEERKYLQETFELSDYIHYPGSLDIRFNVILVDGRRRRECLEKAMELLAAGGTVILHDAERPDCQDLMKQYHGGGEFVTANVSPVPGGLQKLWFGRLASESALPAQGVPRDHVGI